MMLEKILLIVFLSASQLSIDSAKVDMPIVHCFKSPDIELRFPQKKSYEQGEGTQVFERKVD